MKREDPKEESALKADIFPGVAPSAEDVAARVHRHDLKVVLLGSNLRGREFSEFAGEGHEAAVAFGIGEDARLERFAGFLINECTDLHTPARCECQQRSRSNNRTHTNG